jgi:hypothetical protein
MGLHRHHFLITPFQGFDFRHHMAKPYKAVDTGFVRCRHGQIATLKEPSDTGWVHCQGFLPSYFHHLQLLKMELHCQ